MIYNKLNQRGDTIVEVLVATVVLTVVLAGAYTVANRSTRINQASIERTEVANQLAEQAELLRAQRGNFNPSEPDKSFWDEILAKSTTTAGPHDCSPPPSAFAFYLNTDDPLKLGEPKSFVRGGAVPLGIADDAYDDYFDVWIVAEDSPNDSGELSIDNQREFHIRGCWEGIGSEGDQRSEVILRLRL